MSDTVNPTESAPVESITRVELTEEQKRKPIWELVDEILGPVPLEEQSRVPYDAAEQIDHYLYGAPKKEAV